LGNVIGQSAIGPLVVSAVVIGSVERRRLGLRTMEWPGLALGPVVIGSVERRRLGLRSMV
jgi:hypothetical protein